MFLDAPLQLSLGSLFSFPELLYEHIFIVVELLGIEFSVLPFLTPFDCVLERIS